jgi:hypothetical protein
MYINNPGTPEIYLVDLGDCMVVGQEPDCPFGPTPPPRSDRRLKKEINTLVGSLDKLLKIELKEYDWNMTLPMYEYLKERDKLHSIGIIAQEIDKIIPEVVFRNKEGYLGIHYSLLNAYLVEAVKEQQMLIDDIDKDITYLKNKI